VNACRCHTPSAPLRHTIIDHLSAASYRSPGLRKAQSYRRPAVLTQQSDSTKSTITKILLQVLCIIIIIIMLPIKP
jgi:hypothetical protein